MDVLGQRIADVAEQIRCKWRPQRRTDADAATGSSEKGVTFLLWNARTADVSAQQIRSKIQKMCAQARFYSVLALRTTIV